MKITIHPLGPDLHLHRVRPDHGLALRLQSSFRSIAAAGEAFADRFYEHLFAAARSAPAASAQACAKISKARRSRSSSVMCSSRAQLRER